MIEISIPLNINFTMDDEFNIINITEKIRELEIGTLILKLIIKAFNEESTTEFCGEKYKHDKKEKRYERAGTSNRKIITLLGETDFTVDKIRDTETGKIFKPLLPLLNIEPYKNYQEDIAFTSSDIATKSTYRNTVYIMQNFIKKEFITIHY
jgi:hypothetical protein